jgi:CDP-glycerol glycerophosphotransferase (TagB/SpsB family)
VIVSDSAQWIRKGRFQATRGARHVQLWHGVPLKQIELPLYRKRLARLGVVPRFLLGLEKKMTGRYATTDLLVSTSVFVTEQAFRSAFNARDITESGYPRNDVLFREFGAHADDALLWINTDQAAITRMRSARTRGCRVGLYAPTFRKDLSDPFQQGSVDLDKLSTCAGRNNLLLVFKLHPAMKGLRDATGLDHLIEYDPRADVYPALALTDFLVTDYSSIYFDYLFLDKPVLFFPYDYDSYVAQDRNLLFDYEEMTPGIKCRTQEELEAAIGLLCAKNDDGHAAARRLVREKVFARCDAGAAQRILDRLIAHRSNRTSSAS